MTEGAESRPRRRPASLAELPFPMLPAVRWFSPSQLVQTAKFVALSAVFGAYADKREVQATATPPPFHDRSDATDMWVDYVSDIGDGFDATYSVAYLLAAPELDLPALDGPGPAGAKSLPTTRGAVLVMGGDQVYPSASAKNYEERTKGPYNAALPHSDDAPVLFAVPGNHDWYDGLTAFLRFFCQGGWVGGWRTEQRRSYFAVKLPARWWLLGIDIQFDTYIDAPQIAYFQAVAERIQDGDGIILCSAKPSWLEGGATRPEAYATLDYFIAVVLGKAPEQVRLMLAGDSHHYARYTEVDGDRSLVTCGGGGAYLSATHRDDGPLTLPPALLHADRVDPPPSTRFERRAAYPPPEVSRRIALRVLDRLPRRNPGFVGLMVLAQSLLAYVVVSSTRRSSAGGGSLARRWQSLEPAWSALAAFRAPMMLLATTVAVGAATAFYRRGTPTGKVAGPVHGLAHVGVAMVMVWVVAALPLPASWPDWLSFWSRLVAAGVLGGVLATALVGSYLYLAGRFGIHVNEVFSAQSIEDYKSFLRMHIAGNGDLVLYPVAVPRVCRDWRVGAVGDDVDRGSPWVQPAQPIGVHLVEAPVTIRREAAG